jgi:mannose-6-phosphate isomerase-like protein (cupin superfamily)
MANLIEQPTIIEAAGNLPKIIKEYVGVVNSATSEVSIARMKSPGGWKEPGQKPEFSEFSVVLHGELWVETLESVIKVQAGQAVMVSAGEWVRYSTPGSQGAEYISVCHPAFTPETVHRDPTLS